MGLPIVQGTKPTADDFNLFLPRAHDGADVGDYLDGMRPMTALVQLAEYSGSANVVRMIVSENVLFYKRDDNDITTSANINGSVQIDQLGRRWKRLQGDVTNAVAGIFAAAEAAKNDVNLLKIAAEAALDSINTTGRVFTSAEHMAGTDITGTTNGQQFAVLAADLLSYGIWRNNAGVAQQLSSMYTKVFIDLLADLTVDRYYQGKRVLFSRADASNRGGDIITEDGFHYAKYALRGLNGIAISQALDGFFEFALGAVDSLPFTGGATMGGTADYYFAGKKVVRAWGDAGLRASIVETEDGGVYIQRLKSIRGGNGVAVTQAADGFLDLALGAVDSLPFTGGATMGGTADYYFAGKKVVRAWGDAGLRASIVETEDGGVYIQRLKSIRGGNGVAVTQAADGFLDLALGAVDSLPFTGGATMGGTADYYFAGKKVVRAWGDADLRASIVETEDGTVYIPKLASAALDSAGVTAPLETAAYLFEVATVAGKQQLFRRSKTSGVRSQITTVGNNSAPRLSNDGSKLVYSTDRNGMREGYYQLLAGTKYGGSVNHPVLPRKTIMPLGDSLTAQDYASVVAAALGTILLIASDDPAAGIGSQTSTQIAARYGALALTCSLTGNVMGAGANTVTAISVQLLSRVGDAVGTVRTLKASVLGITGSLTSTQSAGAVAGAQAFAGQYYLYTFTPDAGQTLPGAVPAGSALVIDPEARQDSVLLLWIGRNDVGTGAGWQALLKANIAAIFAAYKPLVQQIGLLSIVNATYEPAGSANYIDIVALNLELAALYPGSFIDVRTPYNAGTATDIPAAANTADGLHYAAPGKTAIAGAVTAFINATGWYA